MQKFLMLTMVLLAVAACGQKEPEGEIVGTVDELYNQGADALQNKQFVDAIHAFEELERQHPYSGWATKAQVMSVYAYFRTGQFERSVVEADRFIQMHPGHEDLAYVYYLKGLAYYNQISDVRRDQGFTREALDAFQAVVNRFPDSEYAQDAKLKISLCYDHLAGQEMMVGRYYQEQGRYLASINRFRTVLEEYQTSTHTPEALYRLTETYLALGITDEAQRAAAILGYNFPDSQWYADAYKLLTSANLQQPGDEKSWFGQFFKGVKDTLNPRS